MTNEKWRITFSPVIPAPQPKLRVNSDGNPVRNHPAYWRDTTRTSMRSHPAVMLLGFATTDRRRKLFEERTTCQWQVVREEFLRRLQN